MRVRLFYRNREVKADWMLREPGVRLAKRLGVPHSLYHIVSYRKANNPDLEVEVYDVLTGREIFYVTYQALELRLDTSSLITFKRSRKK